MSDKHRLEKIWTEAWRHIEMALCSNAAQKFSWDDDLLLQTGIAIIANSIEWPEIKDETQIKKIILDAIKVAVERNRSKENLPFNMFFSELSRKKFSIGNAKKSDFYMLSRISFRDHGLDIKLKILSELIHIGSDAHKNFAPLQFDGNEHMITVEIPSSYCPISVKTRAQSHGEAAELCQRALYAFAGFLNGVTSYYTYNLGQRNSLHRINFSKYQLIANNKKITETNAWWFMPYEDTYSFSYNIDVSRINLAIDFFSQINKSKIKNELISSLYLIQMAGSEVNIGLRTLLIWNAIEVLFSDRNTKTSNEKIIHRACFLSNVPRERKIKLEILNKMRNEYAHKAVSSIYADAMFFDARNYLVSVIRYLAQNRWSRMTWPDIHSIFDHSIDVQSIRTTIRKAKLALSVRA